MENAILYSLCPTLGALPFGLYITGASEGQRNVQHHAACNDPGFGAGLLCDGRKFVLTY